MNQLSHLNIVSVLIACFFILPVLVGVTRSFSSERVQNSVVSLFNNLELLFSVILSIYLTQTILSNKENIVLTTIYKIFPSLQNGIFGQEIWLYLIFMVILLLIIDGFLYLITLPVYRYAVVPLSQKISAGMRSMNSFGRRLVSGLWQLPKSILIVLAFCILLNFYTSFNSMSPIAEYADNSAPYQLVVKNIIQPLLNSSFVKNIQVVLNDSFKAPANGQPGQIGKIQLIKYFNGVTLDEAVKSDTEINATALQIVGSETNDKEKAYLIYKWICRNIKYDDNKAIAISGNPSSVSSGAIVAFDTRRGVCFDYATLYVAMCRAVGLKVSFLTGLGYSGTAWGDHAWNQVYYPQENVWINVDTTFGSSGINYFDRPNFNLDHADGVVQGQWS